MGSVWRFLLAGLLLAPALIAGQEKAADVPVRLARPLRGLAVESRLSPPVRRPIPPIIRVAGQSPFAQMTHAAGMIFAGTVTRIERRPAGSGPAIEAVVITFHVENGIRGTAPGSELSITQWAGVWSFGQRYRVGERVLLFLYPRSKLGLTSWVGGPLGGFALDASGRVLLSAEQMAAFRTDSVLGGKSRLSISDFALAVRAGEEE